MVVADILRRQGGCEIAGFLDDIHPDRRGQPFAGAAILGGREQLDFLRATGVTTAIVGVGDNAARLKLAALARARGFELATAIHPDATVADGVTIGEGTAVMAGAVINPGTRVGANAIINTCASIDHECRLEDGVHVSPGVRVAGNVGIGRAAWLATGSIVGPTVNVGAGSIVGAGAVVLANLPSNVLAYGVPAKIIRELPEQKA